MLELIRRHSNSIIVKFFLTVLALTFIFCFGISDVIRKIVGKDYIVKIGNVKIST
ncbi:MAG: SurA N-terminal domain-containing protein, partial [Holosporaceae bacterium]|nr:SurA N-terminal domain-containing protein [Holosporaceae bacterium]